MRDMNGRFGKTSVHLEHGFSPNPLENSSVKLTRMQGIVCGKMIELQMGMQSEVSGLLQCDFTRVHVREQVLH